MFGASVGSSEFLEWCGCECGENLIFTLNSFFKKVFFFFFFFFDDMDLFNKENISQVIIAPSVGRSSSVLLFMFI